MRLRCLRRPSLALLLVAWLGTREGSEGFNLEQHSAVVHQGPAESKFGFSLAQHEGPHGMWVLVGAPEAQTRSSSNGSRGAEGGGGAVFKCAPDTPDRCDKIIYDDKGNRHDGVDFVEDKRHQWLGASVVSRGGVIATCAPRYIWYSVKKNRREPIGGCFVLIGEGGASPTLQPYSPCRTNQWGYHRQGTCQAGFGVAISQGGDKLFVGAVGSWYWQGQVFYQNLLNENEKERTEEGPAQFDTSYMGFSLAAGHLDGDGLEDVAVGVPRGEHLKGMVVLFDHKFKVLNNLTGEQMASYFGYSVCVSDFDGDGLADVAVGAPWFSAGVSRRHAKEEATQHTSPSLYEEGQVTLFKHTPQHKFRRVVRLSGRQSRAHFGLALTSLGDLNGDGFQDLAVGAPEGGDYGGAVYIFLGSKNGILKHHAQVLKASGQAHRIVRTFGWAVSGGFDLDRNEYPDLAVGAPDSSKAFVFRARPVVHVEATFRMKSESGVFDLESKACSLEEGEAVSCHPMSACVKYSGKNVPLTLDFVTSVTLDVGDSESAPGPPRLLLLRAEGRRAFNATVSLRKDNALCNTFYVYAAPDLIDKLAPLISEFRYSLAGAKLASSSSGALLATPPSPMLAPHPFGPHAVVTDRIRFANNCGKDNVCVPNLQGSFAVQNKEYILGSSENVVLRAMIVNAGEDAYHAVAKIAFPSSAVHFSKATSTHSSGVTDVAADGSVAPPILCTLHQLHEMQHNKSSTVHQHQRRNASQGQKEKAHNEDGKMDNTNRNNITSNVIICELGNPMWADAIVSLRLHFQPIKLSDENQAGLEALSFSQSLMSANPEPNGTTHDNFASASLPVVSKSEVDIQGASWPDLDITYNASLYSNASLEAASSPLPLRESDVGPAVRHIYDVVNRGPSDLASVRLLLLWPATTSLGQPLLYLTQAPAVTPQGVVQCTPVQHLNYLNLALDDPLSNDSDNAISSLRKGNVKFHVSRREVSSSTGHLQHLISEAAALPSSQREKIVQMVRSCSATNCTVIDCSAPRMRAGDHFVVRANARLWVNTVTRLGLSELQISSGLIVMGDDRVLRHGSVASRVKSLPRRPAGRVAWLVWMGSAVAGTLLLAVLSLLLWRLGFFKRRRPQDEAQLIRNQQQ